MVRSLSAEAGERLVQRHAAAARVGEDHFDAVVDQRLHEDIGPAHEFVLGLRFGNSGHGITSMRVWKGECGVPSLDRHSRPSSVVLCDRP